MRFYLLIIDDPFLEVLRFVKDDALVDRSILEGAWRRSILIFINRNVLRYWYQAGSHNFMRVRSEGIQLPSFLIGHSSRWNHIRVANPRPNTILIDGGRDSEGYVLCRWVVLLRLRGDDVVICWIVGQWFVDESTVDGDAHILGRSGVILRILCSNDGYLVVLIHSEQKIIQSQVTNLLQFQKIALLVVILSWLKKNRKGLQDSNYAFV